MTRTAPGVAAVVSLLLLGVTSCGNDTGAPGGTLQTPAAKKSALTGSAEKASPKGTLAGLAVLPRGYIADTQNTTGPFTATAFLTDWSAEPAIDRALLLNASFVEGYRATRLSPDKKKRFTLQLFKTGSPAKARDPAARLLGPGDPRALVRRTGRAQRRPGRVRRRSDQTVAVAEVSFVVGALVAELSVQQTGALGTDLRPDTDLLTSLAKEQRARLTATSS